VSAKRYAVSGRTSSGAVANKNIVFYVLSAFTKTCVCIFMYFYRAMVLAWPWACVRPSVRPSQVGVLLKRIKRRITKTTATR